MDTYSRIDGCYDRLKGVGEANSVTDRHTDLCTLIPDRNKYPGKNICPCVMLMGLVDIEIGYHSLGWDGAILYDWM